MQILKRVLSGALSISLALMSVPLGGTLFASAEEPEDQKIVVSLGDSYSSGEGLEPFYGQKDTSAEKVKNPDWIAHRSEASWPGRLELEGVRLADAKDTNWFFAAASGAKTEHMENSFSKSYNYDSLTGTTDLPPQLAVFDALEPGSVDYVTLTLGGNDVGFEEVITNAAYSFIGIGTPVEDDLQERLIHFDEPDGVRDQLKATYTQIAEKAGEQAAILVAGYPTLLSEDGLSINLFGQIITISAEDTQKINAVTLQFNDRIEALVEECREEGMNIHFVPVADAFAGHEAGTDDPYLNGVITTKQSEDFNFSLVSSYSLHPNEKGAAVYADRVQRVLDVLDYGDVSYILPGETADAGYTEESVSDYAMIYGDSTAWTEGWYAVTKDVAISDAITIDGDVNLVLCDDACLMVNGAVTMTPNSHLHIYGQEAGTGTLLFNNTVSGENTAISVNGGSVEFHNTLEINNLNLNYAEHMTVRTSEYDTGVVNLARPFTGNGGYIPVGTFGHMGNIVFEPHPEHQFNEDDVTWNWNPELTAATATLACAGCNYMTENLEAEVVSGVTQEPTETHDGTLTATAIVMYDGKTYQDTRTRTYSAKETDHAVNIADTEHGKVECHVERAYYGDEVVVYVQPDAGYLVDSFDVSGSVEPIEVTKIDENMYLFYMPAADVTVSVQFKDRFADGVGERLEGYSLSLAGDIGINLYMQFDERVLDYPEAKVRFTYEGEDKTDEILVQDAMRKTVGGQEYYVFSCQTAAKDMTQPIYAQVIVDDDTMGEQYTLSVRDYANYLLENANENEAYAAAAPLVRALLNYGTSAQLYFGTRTDALANEDLSEEQKTVSSAEITPENEISAQLPDKLSFEGANLYLKSNTMLCLYFKNESTEEAVFTCGGETLETQDNNGFIQVNIKDIPAQKLFDAYTVSVSCGGEDGTVVYSPMNYCQAAAADENEALQNVIYAFYNLASLARQYA